MIADNSLIKRISALDRVILVDDNPEEYELFKAVLGLQLPQVHVEWLPEGDRLISLLAGLPRPRQASTLVLLDINMPGKGAPQILAELEDKGLLGKTPIVVMSAVERPQDAQFYSRHPAVTFSTTPCGIDDYDRFIRSFGRVIG